MFLLTLIYGVALYINEIISLEKLLFLLFCFVCFFSLYFVSFKLHKVDNSFKEQK